MVIALGLVLAACGGTGQSASPSTGASQSAPAMSETPFSAMSYPETAVDCTANGYTGEFKQIKSIDANTVEFDLCYPDGSFLSKVAFTAFQIQDSDYLNTAMANHLILAKPVGTGPYMLERWSRGDSITLVANPNYTGDNKPKVNTVVFKWSDQAAQRLVELQSGTVDGIDNPGTDDIATIKADSSLALYARAGLNVFYLGMNNNPKVTGFDNSKNPFKRREGPPGDRHGHRPAADRDQLLPRGVDGRRLLHAVRDQVRLRR